MKKRYLITILCLLTVVLDNLVIMTGDTTIALVGLSLIYMGLLYTFCMPNTKKVELVL